MVADSDDPQRHRVRAVDFSLRGEKKKYAYITPSQRGSRTSPVPVCKFISEPRNVPQKSYYWIGERSSLAKNCLYNLINNKLIKRIIGSY